MAKRDSMDGLSHLFGQLKELFSGPSVRQRAGIRDVGEVFVATAQDASASGTSSPNLIHKTARDVWTHVIDGLTGHPMLTRLYAPAGAFWRLPKKGDVGHVVRGRKMSGPGGPMFMIDGGDGQTDNVVPQGLSKDLSFISLPEGFQIESTGDKVVIKSNAGGAGATVTLAKDGSITIQAASGKDVTINGGSKKSARVSDPLAVGSLAGTAGPWPVNFTYVPMQDVAGADTPGVPSVGPTVNLAGIVSNSGGAPNVKE